MTSYQYDNKGMKANCLYCGYGYNEHKKGLECPCCGESVGWN